MSTVKDIDLQHRYHAGVVLYLMREVHKKDIYPSLINIQPLIQYLSKEDLRLVEDLLRYVLYKAEAKQKGKVIDIFVEAVSEKN